MPPRYVYWTILAGGLPTAFRAAEKDELLPTFYRIKEKQPDAEMKYFARGKLWSSPEEALRAEDRDSRHGGGEHRGRDWRPGGDHRDPRQPFKDAKKAQNQERRQRRWEHKHEDREADRPPVPRARGDREGRPFGSAQGGSFRSDRGGRADAPRSRPHGDPFRDDVAPGRGDDRRDRSFVKGSRHGGSPEGRPQSGGFTKGGGGFRGGSAPRRDWQDRPPKADWRDRDRTEREPRGDRPFNARGERAPRREWKDRPPKSFDKPQGRPTGGGGFRGARGDRPVTARGENTPRRDWQDRPPKADWRDRDRDRSEREPRGDRPRSDRPFDKAQGRPFDKAQGRQDWRDRPPKADWRGRERQDRDSREPRGDRPWKEEARQRKPPRTKPHGDKFGKRPFRPKSEGRARSWDRGERGQEDPQPPRPAGPNREPSPGKEPSPEPPPRPSEPVITPPTPERGRESNAGGRLRRKKHD